MKKTAIIIIFIILMLLIAPVVAAAGEGSQLSVKSLGSNIRCNTTSTATGGDSQVSVKGQYQAGPLHLQNQMKIQEQAQVHVQKLNQSQVLMHAGKPAVSSGHGTGQGTVSMITTAPLRAQDQACDVSELKCIVQEKQQKLQLLQLNATEPQYLRSRNTVALAVHTFLAAGNPNLTGGIGPQISLIAQEFNNSVKVTVPAEEKIQSRGGLTRFFFGGDSSAAAEIIMQVDQNHERIREMDLLINSTDCNYEVKEILQEQVQNLRQEQNRLQVLAEHESRDKGIFGGLFG